MGTPDFAVPSLDILLENGYDIVGVITATDKWGGRGNKKRLESAVKKYALEKGLNILQPKNLKGAKFLKKLEALNADLQVVVAFRMLPEVVWNMPTHGTINLHGSLLPKYRGAAPIHWAVINGEKTTGVTSFKLKHEIDTGNMIFQEEIPIGADESTGEVHDRMMQVGAAIVLKTVKAIESGDYTPIAQNESLVSKAPKLTTEICELNFDQPVKKVHDFIRGLNPYPVAWTVLDGLKLKIYRSKIEKIEHQKALGTFISNQKNELKIACQDGFIHLLELQLQGRKKMDVKAFLNGYTIK